MIKIKSIHRQHGWNHMIDIVAIVDGIEVWIEVASNAPASLIGWNGTAYNSCARSDRDRAQKVADHFASMCPGALPCY